MSSLETADGELGREDIENVQCFQNYVQTGSWGGQTHVAICKKHNTKDTKTIQNLNFISKCTYQYIHFRLPLNLMNIESMQIIAYRFIQISKFTAYHEHCLLCRNRTIARNFCIIIDFRKRAFIQLINYLSILNLYIHLHHLISPFSCFLFMGILICCILEIYSRTSKRLDQYL